MVGLFSLLPAVVDAVRVPVIATGGIADARGVAAALVLGASAVQIGTGFLRCPEAKLAPGLGRRAGADARRRTRWSAACSAAGPAAASRPPTCARRQHPSAPAPAPYPVQRGLTQAMRDQAAKAGDVERMQAWAGQSAMLAQAAPAADVVRTIWNGATALLGQS